MSLPSPPSLEPFLFLFPGRARADTVEVSRWSTVETVLDMLCSRFPDYFEEGGERALFWQSRPLHPRSLLADVNPMRGDMFLVGKWPRPMEDLRVGVVGLVGAEEHVSSELATLVEQTCAALREGGVPDPASDGEGGTYFLPESEATMDRRRFRMRERKRMAIAVFKPLCEEPMCPNNPRRRGMVGQVGLRGGILAGEGYLREIGAYLLDSTNRICPAGVPRTCAVLSAHESYENDVEVMGRGVEVLRPDFAGRKVTKDKVEGEEGGKGRVVWKLGSLQEYVPARDTFGDWHPSKYSRKAVQRIALLDLRIKNRDRHDGNIFVKKVRPPPSASPLPPTSDLDLIPFDHGLSFPGSLEGEVEELVWYDLEQVKGEVVKEVVEFVKDLDVEKDVALLRSHLSLRPACVFFFFLSNLALKRCIVDAHLSLHDTARVLYREDNTRPAPIELAYKRAKALALSRAKKYTSLTSSRASQPHLPIPSMVRITSAAAELQSMGVEKKEDDDVGGVEERVKDLKVTESGEVDSEHPHPGRIRPPSPSLSSATSTSTPFLPNPIPSSSSASTSISPTPSPTTPSSSSSSSSTSSPTTRRSLGVGGVGGVGSRSSGAGGGAVKVGGFGGGLAVPRRSGIARQGTEYGGMAVSFESHPLKKEGRVDERVATTHLSGTVKPTTHPPTPPPSSSPSLFSSYSRDMNIVEQSARAAAQAASNVRGRSRGRVYCRSGVGIGEVLVGFGSGLDGGVGKEDGMVIALATGVSREMELLEKIGSEVKGVVCVVTAAVLWNGRLTVAAGTPSGSGIVFADGKDAWNGMKETLIHAIVTAAVGGDQADAKRIPPLPPTHTLALLNNATSPVLKETLQDLAAAPLAAFSSSHPVTKFITSSSSSTSPLSIEKQLSSSSSASTSPPPSPPPPLPPSSPSPHPSLLTLPLTTLTRRISDALLPSPHTSHSPHSTPSPIIPPPSLSSALGLELYGEGEKGGAIGRRGAKLSSVTGKLWEIFDKTSRTGKGEVGKGEVGEEEEGRGEEGGMLCVTALGPVRLLDEVKKESVEEEEDEEDSGGGGSGGGEEEKVIRSGKKSEKALAFMPWTSTPVVFPPTSTSSSPSGVSKLSVVVDEGCLRAGRLLGTRAGMAVLRDAGYRYDSLTSAKAIVKLSETEEHEEIEGVLEVEEEGEEDEEDEEEEDEDEDEDEDDEDEEEGIGDVKRGAWMMAGKSKRGTTKHSSGRLERSSTYSAGLFHQHTMSNSTVPSSTPTTPSSLPSPPSSSSSLPPSSSPTLEKKGENFLSCASTPEYDRRLEQEGIKEIFLSCFQNQLDLVIQGVKKKALEERGEAKC